MLHEAEVQILLECSAADKAMKLPIRPDAPSKMQQPVLAVRIQISDEDLEHQGW